jgi:hypothetical protein
MEDKHFEDLWVECENFHKAESNNDKKSVLDQIKLIIDLYLSIDNKEINDKQHSYNLLLGELLLLISNLSLIDNVNVYIALKNALTIKSIEAYSNIIPK